MRLRTIKLKPCSEQLVLTIITALAQRFYLLRLGYFSVPSGLFLNMLRNYWYPRKQSITLTRKYPNKPGNILLIYSQAYLVFLRLCSNDSCCSLVFLRRILLQGNLSMQDIPHRHLDQPAHSLPFDK